MRQSGLSEHRRREGLVARDCIGSRGVTGIGTDRAGSAMDAAPAGLDSEEIALAAIQIEKLPPLALAHRADQAGIERGSVRGGH